MKTALATALAAVAIVGIGSTPAVAVTVDQPSATPTQLSADDDLLRSTVEFTCEKGYTYQITAAAFNARSTYQSTGVTKKDSGRCTGKVQRRRFTLQEATSGGVLPQGPFTAVAVITVTGGPCLATDVVPGEDCLAVGFNDFTV